MPWVKIDADLQSHHKIRAVGPWGELLHVRAIGYSRLHLTDGLIDPYALRSLTVDFDPSVSLTIADLMVEATLFERSEKGFIVHDYSEWNQTRKEVEQTSLKRKQAGRLGGIAKGWHGAKVLLKQKSSRGEKIREEKNRSETTTTPISPKGDCPLCHTLMAFMNETGGTSFPTSGAYLANLHARHEEAGEEACRKVIRVTAAMWVHAKSNGKGDRDMSHCYQPGTIFRPTKFPNYLGKPDPGDPRADDWGRVDGTVIGTDEP